MEGPKIIFTIPIFGGLPITETVVLSWFIIALVFVLCRVLTYRMKKIPSRRQAVAEKLVELVEKLVRNTMGEKFMRFSPFIASLFAFSLFGSLISLLGLRPVTADLNTTMSWALLTFILIQVERLKAKKLKGYLKSFVEPVPFMLPLNIISELSTPVSMGFRHFGNIAGGMVITSLLYGALASLSSMLFLPVPLLQVGIPAILSIYFDLFTGFLQAFIFCMLTMVFVSSAAD